jgi:hypothetical protein
MSILNGFNEEIMNDNLYHFNRFKNFMPDASYIAGFIDGDGCIFIRKIKDGFQTGIQISQSRTNLLLILQYYFGGIIRQTHMNRTNQSNTTRNQYVLNIRSNEYELLLNHVYHHIIIKTQQIKSLKEISKYVNKPNLNDKKEECYDICTIANKNKIFDCQHLIKMNIDYISGLFDSEGCFYINKNRISSFRISIAQKSHPEVLEYVKQYLGFGNINGFSYYIYSKDNCLKFIELVENNLIVKYNQSQYFKKYLLTNDYNIKYEMYDKCNYEKHVNEDFNYDLYFNVINKENYNYYTVLHKNKKKILFDISNNNLIEKLKLVKEKKNEQIKKKNKRDKICDEVILKVREKINEGKQNIEIENELNLKRHVVSRIKNNIIVLKNETKRKNIKKTQEQKNIEKRKINIDVILKIIDKIIENKLPSIILNEILEENLNNECKLTIDIVKNIKKKIKDKIIPFYDFEVSEDMYNHYKKLIE